MPMISIRQIVLIFLVAVASASEETAVFSAPLFTAQDLVYRTEELAKVLSTTGLLSIAAPDSFSAARQDAFRGMCACMRNTKEQNKNLFSKVQGVDTSLLADGTTRTTLATATVGSTPLALKEDELVAAGCSAETIASMDMLRDHVAFVSQEFMKALDSLLLHSNDGSSPQALLDTTTGEEFYSVGSIVKSAQNLEHFHVYEKGEKVSEHQDSDSGLVLDVHTDAGLFLSFVPGLSCNDVNDPTSNFYVQHEGALQRAEFASGSIAIMLGIGAERWLRHSIQLRATRHAVQMDVGQNRAWYGMSKCTVMCVCVSIVFLTFKEVLSFIFSASCPPRRNNSSFPEEIICRHAEGNGALRQAATNLQRFEEQRRRDC
jgi:hypothetical protein